LWILGTCANEHHHNHKHSQHHDEDFGIAHAARIAPPRIAPPLL
jgi:hypothetical protein